MNDYAKQIRKGWADLMKWENGEGTKEDFGIDEHPNQEDGDDREQTGRGD